MPTRSQSVGRKSTWLTSASDRNAFPRPAGSLNANGARVLVAPPDGVAPVKFVDVNGDNLASPSDVLQVINFLNQQIIGLPEGEGQFEAPQVLALDSPFRDIVAYPFIVLGTDSSRTSTTAEEARKLDSRPVALDSLLVDVALDGTIDAPSRSFAREFDSLDPDLEAALTEISDDEIIAKDLLFGRLGE